MKKQRPKHFDHLSLAAKLLEVDLFPSFYQLLAEGKIRQSLFLPKFSDIEGFIEFSKISPKNRSLLSQSCEANQPADAIEIRLRKEKADSSLHYEEDPWGKLLKREYVYLSTEISGSGYPSLTHRHKWSDSFVTGTHNQMSDSASFNVWVIEARDGTQLVGLRNISDGYGVIAPFNIGAPKDNKNVVPELFRNACISIREIEDYLEEEIPDEAWEKYLNPPIDEHQMDRESDDFFYLKRRRDNSAEAILHFGNELSNKRGRIATARELWNYIYAQANLQDGLDYGVEFYLSGSKTPNKTLTDSQLKHPQTCVCFKEESLLDFKAFSKRVANATKRARNK